MMLLKTMSWVIFKSIVFCINDLELLLSHIDWFVTTNRDRKTNKQIVLNERRGKNLKNGGRAIRKYNYCLDFIYHQAIRFDFVSSQFYKLSNDIYHFIHNTPNYYWTRNRFASSERKRWSNKNKNHIEYKKIAINMCN